MDTPIIRLLLADDDIDDCAFFQDVLKELSINTKLEIVNDGVQLMQSLAKNEEPLPDAVYLDLNMPRLNGFDCLTRIKQDEKLKQVPVIIFSTSFDADVVNRLYDRGANFYIRKPADFAHLKQVVSKSIDIICESPNVQVPKDKFVLTA